MRSLAAFLVTFLLAGAALAQDEPSRPGRNGLALHLLGSAPVAPGYGPNVAGMGFGLGYWIDLHPVVIEPRVAIRFSSPDRNGSYQEVPIDLHVSYLVTDEEVTPFVGGALGVRFLHDRRRVHVVSGTILQTTSDPVLDDRAWGPGITARAGLVFFRTRPVRLVLALEYDALFVTVNDRRNPQAVGLDVGLVF